MSALRAARELRSFLRRYGSRTPGSAAAVVEALASIVPADCLALSSWDPAGRRHRTLASSYPGTATSYFDDEWHRDPLFQVPRLRREPVRICDLDISQRHGAVFDRVIDPAGFRDGVTQCLYAADGRYVGMVNANSLTNQSLDDDVVNLMDLLAADLAAAIDPVTTPPALTARLADGDAEGFLVAVDGTVTPLSPGANPALLSTQTPSVVGPGHHLQEGTTLLLVGQILFAVDLARWGDQTLVLHRQITPPAALTVRELHVLAMLADGHSNKQIGQRCGISDRTVATHVEHILLKIGARTRAEAAGRSAQWRLVATP